MKRINKRGLLAIALIVVLAAGKDEDVALGNLKMVF